MKDLFVKVVVFFILTSVLFAEDFAFEGTHFIASYTGCDKEALANIIELEHVFYEAVRSSGATVLGSASHVFPPDGMTLIILLSESHASIHTYPEHDSCFVDLFTCGNRCSFEAFDRALKSYLQPESAESRILLRGQEIYDFSKSD